MEGLVNYSSEDEQDDYPYKKVVNIQLVNIWVVTGSYNIETKIKKRWLTTT